MMELNEYRGMRCIGLRDFPFWLREERNKRGISSRTLSIKVGKSATYISQIERGLIKEVPDDIIGKIQKVLNTHTEFEKGSQSLFVNEDSEQKIRLREKILTKIDGFSIDELSSFSMMIEEYPEITYKFINVLNDLNPTDIKYVLESIKIVLDGIDSRKLQNRNNEEPS